MVYTKSRYSPVGFYCLIDLLIRSPLHIIRFVKPPFSSGLSSSYGGTPAPKASQSADISDLGPTCRQGIGTTARR